MPTPNTFAEVLTRRGNPRNDGQKVRKLPFIISFFETEMASGSGRAFIEIERVVLERRLYDSLDAEYWSHCEERLSKTIVIEHEKTVEDTEDALIVDFANAFIGGGALRTGLA